MADFYESQLGNNYGRVLFKQLFNSYRPLTKFDSSEVRMGFSPILFKDTEELSLILGGAEFCHNPPRIFLAPKKTTKHKENTKKYVVYIASK